MTAELTLRRALGHAEGFLTTSHAASGQWQDFTSRAFGSSTLWVTGYTAWCLAESQPRAHLLQRVSQHLLACQQAEDIGGWGWGYTNVGFPSDADTTALCTLFLRTQGILSAPLTTQLRAFLLEHRRGDGGFATFYRPGILVPLPYFAAVPSVAGWCTSHVSVTATVIQALKALGSAPDTPSLSDAYAFLLRQQRSDGLWSDYWWAGTFYPTYQSVRAIRTLPSDSGLEARLELTRDALLAQRHPGGYWSNIPDGEPCPFSTALAVHTLLTIDPRLCYHDAIAGSVAWLLAQQRADGSWTAPVILQIPWPADLQPNDARIKRKSPVQRVFSTATVSAALAALARAYGEALRELAVGEAGRLR